MVPVSDAVTATAPWVLGAEGVNIRRGWHRIIVDFSWEHRPGRIAWLVGENGTGKSSLLRVLAGRSRPSAGRVRRLGSRGEEGATLYYHPDMHLPASATVSDWQRLERVLLAGGRTSPLDPDFIPPGAIGAKRLGRLSTGEGKRLLLAALLRREAPFLFLDEPYEHLSREGKALLTRQLLERARRHVVIVATNQEIPPEAGATVLYLDGDRVTFSNEPARSATERFAPAIAAPEDDHLHAEESRC